MQTVTMKCIMAHKILIVEDDVDDQILFVEAITSIDSSYDCVAVGNGMEGLEHLTNTNTLPSLVLLDLNMPLMNGYEFLEKVKRDIYFKDIPIVVFSTSNAVNDRVKTTSLGAVRFFTKPKSVSDLKVKLIEILFFV